MSVKCYKCYNDLPFKLESNVSRSEHCPKCFTDLRACKMCIFFDSKSYNECKEPTADRITEKEKANFCDHFKIGAAANAGKTKEDLLNMANTLFKKK